jgi:hypothetical protein
MNDIVGLCILCFFNILYVKTLCRVLAGFYDAGNEPKGSVKKRTIFLCGYMTASEESSVLVHSCN